MSAPRIITVGSVNLDLVAACETLPRPGETVTGATFAQYPGGKGANQALAARRLGAEIAAAAVSPQIRHVILRSSMGVASLEADDTQLRHHHESIS